MVLPGTNDLFRSLGEEDHHNHDDGSDETNSSTWGQAMLGALVVFLLTFTGIFTMAAYRGFARVKHLPSTLTHLVVPSFASGALLATSIFLLIPESMELLAAPRGSSVGGAHRLLEEDDHTDHNDDGHSDHSFAWKVGTAFICGFILPLVLHAFFPHPSELIESQERSNLSVTDLPKVVSGDDDNEANLSQDKREGNIDEAGDCEVTFPGECDSGDCCHKDNEECGSPTTTQNWPLVMSIMVSDFFCNFADGVFIGSGFLLCSKEVAYAIVASTVYHEFAQEIADFVLLTHTCRFSVAGALLMNALHGTGVFLGVVLILAAEPSQASIGVLLAFSAGVFMYITSAECIPKIQHQLHQDFGKTMLFLLCFLLGAVPIGLVLMNHQHCEVGSQHDHRV
eukprot:scaffold1369_cov163-Amphora_coffeaeformis.AAC.2